MSTVFDPSEEYRTFVAKWKKCRAVCSGQDAVKEVDRVVSMKNLLIPFSPSMTQAQYELLLAEAELPGITSQFAKTLLGGLLRKTPTIKLPDSVPSEALNWLKEEFGQDDSSMISFLDTAIWEELVTSRCWVYIDYPTEVEGILPEDSKPYPVIWPSETVINVQVEESDSGRLQLKRVVQKGFVEDYTNNEFHPEYIETCWVHEIDEAGYYQIRVFSKGKNTVEEETITNLKLNGNRLDFIPAWPLNGSLEAQNPSLCVIIDKEISLYNKISRRNHLLYGAATYTPIIFSDMMKDEFDKIVDGGLGSWLLLGKEDKADVLKTPTEALADMEKAIVAAIEEMAKLGIRMLSPETDQSGVALHLRNAAQTASLASLNTKISATMRQIIAFMLMLKYKIDVDVNDIEFTLSSDFKAYPYGPEWLKLIAEWYELGLIPRSIFVSVLKHNDVLPTDYEDEEGLKEINEDQLIIKKEPHENSNESGLR